MRIPMLQMMRRGLLAAVTCAGFLCLPLGVNADTTTQPDNVNAAATGMRPGPAYVIKSFKDAVAKLDLSDDEKPRGDAVFDQVAQQGLQLSQTLADTPLQERYPKLIAFGKQIRQELAAVLTDDQMALLDQYSTPRIPQGANGNRAAPGGAIIDNLQNALGKLDLTDDQKQQIKGLLDSTRQQIADLRQKAANGDNVQQDIQQIRQNMRDKLQTILSPDQMQSLQEAMQQYRQDHGTPGGANGPGKSNAPVADNKPADLTSDGPDAGSPVPAIQLIETNGRVFTPSNYKGHVLVLEFGSLSSPVFRQHVQEMEKLKSAEGPRAFFLIVYTREAFPAGAKDIEQNRTDGIAVQDSKTLDERKAQAIQTQQQLNITIPMAVDSMDNAVSTAFGGFPNGAVVIGKDGTIAARQQWTNPDTLRLAIDDACQGQAN